MKRWNGRMARPPEASAGVVVAEVGEATRTPGMPVDTPTTNGQVEGIIVASSVVVTPEERSGNLSTGAMMSTFTTTTKANPVNSWLSNTKASHRKASAGETLAAADEAGAGETTVTGTSKTIAGGRSVSRDALIREANGEVKLPEASQVSKWKIGTPTKTETDAGVGIANQGLVQTMMRTRKNEIPNRPPANRGD
jgi:hypothetical protein